MLTLLEGSCLPLMRCMVNADERYQLAYIDPPFLSQEDYRTRDGELAFSDRWRSADDYFDMVQAACVAAFDLLTPDGCLVLHVDPKTSAYHRLRLDLALGARRFASEIIWRYRRWPSKTTNFQRVHDVLLRYVRDPKVSPRWTQLYEPLATSTRQTWGDRKQRALVDDSGRRARSSTTDEQSPGVPIGDVWEIGIIAPVANERTGYPTQKPEALLERLISALTLPSDRVLDPMCGSGTTLAVAARLGRDAVGIDSSPVAIRYARERLGRWLDEKTEAAC